MVWFSLKVEIYTVPLLTFDKFAGTHQLFIGMSTVSHQLEKHRLQHTAKILISCHIFENGWISWII
jgi:hypothetical protein